MSIYYFLQRKCFGNALNMYHRRCPLASNTLYVILRSCIATTWESPGREPYYKTHARYFCTCVEKRRTQAKEWALSPPIMWFQKHSVRRAERYPCYCPISHKIRICRSIALFNNSERWISNIAYSTSCEALMSLREVACNAVAISRKGIRIIWSMQCILS